jgi:hypothetical protein
LSIKDRDTVAHDRTSIEPNVLNSRQEHWERLFAANPEMYGEHPSEPAQKAVEVFTQAGITTIHV